MQDELVKPMFEIVKGIVAIQTKHQQIIEGLLRSYQELLAHLAGAEDASTLPAPSAEALRKAAAEVAELERLFSRESNPPNAGTSGEVV